MTRREGSARPRISLGRALALLAWYGGVWPLLLGPLWLCAEVAGLGASALLCWWLRAAEGHPGRIRLVRAGWWRIFALAP